MTALTTGSRGRPVRLGQHDQTVQECIKELLRSGEKVNAFVAIATARQVGSFRLASFTDCYMSFVALVQVLLQQEPTLLDEMGGPVKLNVTWAKSFLKRMGVGKQRTRQSTSDHVEPPN